jgi:hypothetical protein
MDRLPAWLRTLLYQVIPVVLGWLATDIVPALQHRNPLIGALAAVVLTQLVLWLTPATRQFGVGADGRRVAKGGTPV